MTIKEWIHNKEIHGESTFSIEDVKREFPSHSVQGLRTMLARFVNSGRLYAAYRGFYVIVPVQYQLKGIVPPTYYIDDLMNWLHKPYYVGLLSAASIYGASHQKAMVTQVMTMNPTTKSIAQNKQLVFVQCSAINPDFLITKNGEMSPVKFSSPELTAVDLIQFAGHIGGYQRVATVLAELIDSVDMGKMQNLLQCTSTATLQRLGYILDFVLEEQQKADQLFAFIEQSSRKSILLSNKHLKNPNATSNRWHVNANIDIEIDEL